MDLGDLGLFLQVFNAVCACAAAIIPVLAAAAAVEGAERCRVRGLAAGVVLGWVATAGLGWALILMANPALELLVMPSLVGGAVAFGVARTITSRGGHVTAEKFSPGFRLSTPDACVLVAGTVVAVTFASAEWWYGLAAGIPLAHFFLFCNVFRVSRPLELLWAAAFVALAVATILWGVPGWWATALACVIVAAVFVAVEMRRPSYHGVGWRRVNPGLREWWEARAAKGKDVSPKTTPGG